MYWWREISSCKWGYSILEFSYHATNSINSNIYGSIQIDGIDLQTINLFDYTFLDSAARTAISSSLNIPMNMIADVTYFQDIEGSGRRRRQRRRQRKLTISSKLKSKSNFRDLSVWNLLPISTQDTGSISINFILTDRLSNFISIFGGLTIDDVSEQISNTLNNNDGNAFLTSFKQSITGSSGSGATKQIIQSSIFLEAMSTTTDPLGGDDYTGDDDSGDSEDPMALVKITVPVVLGIALIVGGILAWCFFCRKSTNGSHSKISSAKVVVMASVPTEAQLADDK